MITFKRALNIIEKEFDNLNLKTERVSLLDSLNRITAENVYADCDQPSFTNSAMDGYAIKYNKGINTWRITGEIKAGEKKNISIKMGEAVEIMTGAKLPIGADTVIPLENSLRTDCILHSAKNKILRRGEFVRSKGEDVKKKQLLIKKKTLLSSRNITMAAFCGKKSLKVLRKLKIGVIATGDELIDIDVKPKKDSVRASNLYSLISAIAEMNMTPVTFGIVRDKNIDLKKRIKCALDSGIDILLTTGGISAGKYDMLKDVFRKLNVNIRFSGVSIKPGKPLVFGTYVENKRRVLIYGLPGNPVSCYVNFVLFVRNVILNALTLNGDYRSTAILNNSVIKYDKKRYFLTGIIQNGEGVCSVSQTGSQSSANIGGLNKANCLIVFSEKKQVLKKGNIIECIMM